MEKVYDWLRQIFAFMIISNMFTSLFASGKYADYIKMALKLILIIIIITPIINAVGNENVINKNITSIYEKLEKNLVTLSGTDNSLNVDNSGKTSNTAVLTSSLAKSIKQNIKPIADVYGAVITDVEVEVNDNWQENVELKTVTIYMQKLNKSDKESFRKEVTDMLITDTEVIKIKLSDKEV